MPRLNFEGLFGSGTDHSRTSSGPRRPFANVVATDCEAGLVDQRSGIGPGLDRPFLGDAATSIGRSASVSCAGGRARALDQIVLDLEGSTILADQPGDPSF